MNRGALSGSTDGANRRSAPGGAHRERRVSIGNGGTRRGSASHQHQGEALLQLAGLRHRHLARGEQSGSPRGRRHSRAPGQRLPVRALHVPHPRPRHRGAVGEAQPVVSGAATASRSRPARSRPVPPRRCTSAATPPGGALQGRRATGGRPKAGSERGAVIGRAAPSLTNQRGARSRGRALLLQRRCSGAAPAMTAAGIKPRPER